MAEEDDSREGPPADGAGATTEGTFLVTEADEASAVLRDVRTSQVHALAENPGFAAGEVVDAALAPAQPLAVAWSVESVAARREIPVERSPERPTKQARELAADQDVGEVTRRDRAGEGELHVLTVPADRTEAAVEDVIADEETVVRAARLGVDRVEVRAANGVLSVRYLP